VGFEVGISVATKKYLFALYLPLVHSLVLPFSLKKMKESLALKELPFLAKITRDQAVDTGDHPPHNLQETLEKDLNCLNEYANYKEQTIKEHIQNWADQCYVTGKKNDPSLIRLTNATNIVVQEENNWKVYICTLIIKGQTQSSLLGWIAIKKLENDKINIEFMNSNTALCYDKILVFGYSTKRGVDGVSGYFGEGVKVELNLLVSIGAQIHYFTKGTSWEFYHNSEGIFHARIASMEPYAYTIMQLNNIPSNIFKPTEFLLFLPISVMDYLDGHPFSNPSMITADGAVTEKMENEKDTKDIKIKNKKTEKNGKESLSLLPPPPPAASATPATPATPLFTSKVQILFNEETKGKIFAHGIFIKQLRSETSSSIRGSTVNKKEEKIEFGLNYTGEKDMAELGIGRDRNSINISYIADYIPQTFVRSSTSSSRHPNFSLFLEKYYDSLMNMEQYRYDFDPSYSSISDSDDKSFAKLLIDMFLFKNGKEAIPIKQDQKENSALKNQAKTCGKILYVVPDLLYLWFMKSSFCPTLEKSLKENINQLLGLPEYILGEKDRPVYPIRQEMIPSKEQISFLHHLKQAISNYFYNSTYYQLIRFKNFAEENLVISDDKEEGKNQLEKNGTQHSTSLFADLLFPVESSQYGHYYLINIRALENVFIHEQVKKKNIKTGCDGKSPTTATTTGNCQCTLRILIHELKGLLSASEKSAWADKLAENQFQNVAGNVSLSTLPMTDDLKNQAISLISSPIPVASSKKKGTGSDSNATVAAEEKEKEVVRDAKKEEKLTTATSKTTKNDEKSTPAADNKEGKKQQTEIKAESKTVNGSKGVAPSEKQTSLSSDTDDEGNYCFESFSSVPPPPPAAASEKKSVEGRISTPAATKKKAAPSINTPSKTQSSPSDQLLKEDTSPTSARSTTSSRSGVTTGPNTPKTPTTPLIKLREKEPQPISTQKKLVKSITNQPINSIDELQRVANELNEFLPPELQIGGKPSSRSTSARKSRGGSITPTKSSGSTPPSTTEKPQKTASGVGGSLNKDLEKAEASASQQQPSGRGQPTSGQKRMPSTPGSLQISPPPPQLTEDDNEMQIKTEDREGEKGSLLNLDDVIDRTAKLSLQYSKLGGGSGKSGEEKGWSIPAHHEICRGCCTIKESANYELVPNQGGGATGTTTTSVSIYYDTMNGTMTYDDYLKDYPFVSLNSKEMKCLTMMITFLSTFFEYDHSLCHIVIEDSAKIAFNYQKELYFNVFAMNSLFNRGPFDCLHFYLVTFCHEITHNLHSGHDEVFVTEFGYILHAHLTKYMFFLSKLQIDETTTWHALQNILSNSNVGK
jgi:hypothetical protein